MSMLQLETANTSARVIIYRYVAVIKQLQCGLLQKAEELSGIHEKVHANISSVKVSKLMHAKANQNNP